MSGIIVRFGSAAIRLRSASPSITGMMRSTMTAQGRMPTVTIRCSAGEQTRQRLAAVRVVVDDADRANVQMRCGLP